MAGFQLIGRQKLPFCWFACISPNNYYFCTGLVSISLFQATKLRRWYSNLPCVSICERRRNLQFNLLIISHQSFLLVILRANLLFFYPIRLVWWYFYRVRFRYHRHFVGGSFHGMLLYIRTE